LEDAGVIVARCDFGTRQVDALSLYAPEDELPPLIFVNAMSPGDRVRFSLAHECGHLVLHQATPPQPEDDVEGEADRFAAELLTPRMEVRPYLNRPTLAKLASLKPYWKVSMRSLIEQAARVGQIAERQRRYLHMQMAKAGYLDVEPNPIEIEQPSMLREIVECHLEQLDYSEGELSKALRLKPDEMKAHYIAGRPSIRLLSVVTPSRGLRPVA
jgi:Zn-dependent peptidase ImmA (M78 family)